MEPFQRTKNMRCIEKVAVKPKKITLSAIFETKTKSKSKRQPKPKPKCSKPESKTTGNLQTKSSSRSKFLHANKILQKKNVERVGAESNQKKSKQKSTA